MEQVSEAKTKILNETPDASGWSEAMDALLLQRRVEKKLPWRAVAPIGAMNARRCQTRLKVLLARAGRPVAPVAAEVVVAFDRDGLDWLQRKGKLTPRRRAAALHYRRVFREGDGLSMKSCLNVTVGGSDAGGMQLAMVACSDARRDLVHLRTVVLHGQDDLLTVADGVCGVGHTPRSLAGDDGSDRCKRRQSVLEAVLMVALDLIAQELDRRQRTAA